MTRLYEQEREIETMRARLHQLVLEKEANMIDPEVAELSAQLDILIVKYQKAKAAPLPQSGSLL